MPELDFTRCACLLAALCVHCVGAEHPGFGEAGGESALELHASDARGEPADLQQLPRRPRLLLQHPDGIEPDPEAIALLAGAPDAALRDDLERAPLASAQLLRRVDSGLQATGTELWIVPRSPLAPGAEYTLAVAAWARSRRGGSLDHDGSAALFELRTGAEPDAGARVVQSWPADGSSGVGTNLQSAVIAFDGSVTGVQSAVWLEDPNGLAVPSQLTSGPCAEVAPEHAAPFCVRLAIDGRLAPAALHRLVVGSEARDDHGAPIGPWHAGFQTAEGRDAQPPATLLASCAIDEQPVAVGCALVDDSSVALRLQADEAVIATLELGGEIHSVAAADGRIELQVTDLAPDSAHPATLDLHDSAGNAVHHQLDLRTTPPLATFAIVEVLADPRGPEPQQEFVEILNYGPAAADLIGLHLDDRTDALGTPIERSLRVPARARVLLVAEGYDPREGSDPAPPPGAALVRVGRALGSAGLRNAGEALFLRDAFGHRLSAAPAGPRPRPGVCAVRTSADLRSGAVGSFDYDPNDTCTPGE